MMKNTTSGRFGNRHVAALTKTDQDILFVYDLIKINGKIPSHVLVNKQIGKLKRQTNSGTGIKFLFTCC